MQSFFDLQDLEPDSIKNRILRFIFFVGLFVMGITTILAILTYFMLGFFVLDGIYYIFSGKTIVWRHLYK